MEKPELGTRVLVPAEVKNLVGNFDHLADSHKAVVVQLNDGQTIVTNLMNLEAVPEVPKELTVDEQVAQLKTEADALGWELKPKKAQTKPEENKKVEKTETK